jgi:predicted N-acetyltransferase YhbS
MTIDIRGELPADAGHIMEVTELAFRHAAHTCGQEHRLVGALRAAGVTLSLRFVQGVDHGTVTFHAAFLAAMAEPCALA